MATKKEKISMLIRLLNKKEKAMEREKRLPGDSEASFSKWLAVLRAVVADNNEIIIIIGESPFNLRSFILPGTSRLVNIHTTKEFERIEVDMKNRPKDWLSALKNCLWDNKEAYFGLDSVLDEFLKVICTKSKAKPEE
ncbi:MAG: hypothetical protein WCW26_01935 [Candidatus Buchananbacteria bacterium]